MGVSLAKGQRISLDKEAGGQLTRAVMGLGWDTGSVDIDLDASCLLFDAGKNLVDAVWFRQLKSKDGSIQHSGDNRTGAGDGDDETIRVELAALPAPVTNLVFVVNSFTGQNFSQVRNAFCRLVDGNGRELARYDLSASGSQTGQVMARLYRHGTEWKLHAIGEPVNGRTFHDMLGSITPHLQ
jgi:tellurium resistance protein TerZ